MYELIILGFLMRSISHGYHISKIINDMIGPYAKVSSGRLYPLFDKLAREGFIVIVQGEGNSRHRQYKITEKGRQRFHQLMMDTTSNLGEYRKLFAFKFIFIDLLQPNEQMYLLEHYINYCQTHIFFLDGKMEELKQREFNAGFNMWKSYSVMEHTKSQWQLELQWATKVRDELSQEYKS
jgi:DNA-binding PadR family transcriptional regulator